MLIITILVNNFTRFFNIMVRITRPIEKKLYIGVKENRKNIASKIILLNKSFLLFLTTSSVLRVDPFLNPWFQKSDVHNHIF